VLDGELVALGIEGSALNRRDARYSAVRARRGDREQMDRRFDVLRHRVHADRAQQRSMPARSS
jgi:hypothetical protein